MSDLYEVLLDTPTAGSKWDDPITTQFSRDTEFEAIARVFYDEDNGKWSGFIVFKDKRFSPDEIFEMPGMRVKHFTPSAASGALAMSRAESQWNTLREIFQKLIKSSREAGGNEMLEDVEDFYEDGYR